MKRKMAELRHCKDGCEWSWYWVNYQVSAKLPLHFHALLIWTSHLFCIFQKQHIGPLVFRSNCETEHLCMRVFLAVHYIINKATLRLLNNKSSMHCVCWWCILFPAALYLEWSNDSFHVFFSSKQHHTIQTGLYMSMSSNTINAPTLPTANFQLRGALMLMSFKQPG